jgi:RNA polymerase sigma-70 factor (ECF subfamily)
MLRLVEPVIRRCAAYAQALVRNRAAADDLVQDVPGAGHQSIGSSGAKCDPRPWLFTILH